MSNMITTILGSLLLVIGLFFTAVGCIGVIRFPDIYNRLQAATKCVTLGTCSILLATMVFAGMGAIGLKCLICMGFILITSPTAAHALARASHAFGIKLWDKSVINDYDEDKTDHQPKSPS
ncbi:MAG: monovalent cation/H(+) antiporter subunit G [Chitinivibrionales bacterium]|nr:monovalent cation/H(+) antiporter subunit G [Chitinivibrionales bacterium]